jgi:hypothetical protein
MKDRISNEDLSDARRFVHGSVPRGELRALLFDLLADVEMGVPSSDAALREVIDHQNVAKADRHHDPNAESIAAACSVVRDIIAGIKRCPYCRRDVSSPTSFEGCVRTHVSKAPSS